jgi:hypothetical protein
MRFSIRIVLEQLIKHPPHCRGQVVGISSAMTLGESQYAWKRHSLADRLNSAVARSKHGDAPAVRVREWAFSGLEPPESLTPPRRHTMTTRTRLKPPLGACMDRTRIRTGAPTSVAPAASVGGVSRSEQFCSDCCCQRAHPSRIKPPSQGDSTPKHVGGEWRRHARLTMLPL